MKKLFLVILVFSFLSAKSQTPQPSGFPVTNSVQWITYGWIKNDSGNVAAVRDTNFMARFIGTVVYKIRPGIDSVFYISNGATTGKKWNRVIGIIPTQFNPIAGTGISLSGSYPNITFTNTSPAISYLAGYGLVLSGITFRVDSAALRPRLYTAGTGISINATTGVITNTILGNTLSNIGTGFRWAVPNSNNVKTFSNGWGFLLDSTSTANTLTGKVDSNAIKQLAGIYDATVDFSASTNPNTGGTTFNPNTPQLTTKIYVSTINGSQWTWNGSVYVLYINPDWGTFGNAGTNTTDNFIGTTDNIDLRFRVNNEEAGRIENSNSNTALGLSSMNNLAGGIGNSSYGAGSLNSISTGNYNTSIGQNSLNLVTNKSYNIGIGTFAGARTNLDSHFFVNPFNLEGIDVEDSLSYMYGIMNIDPSLSTLKLNSHIYTPYIPSGAGIKSVRINPSNGEITYADTAIAVTSLPISSLTAATQSNVIDNTNYVQQWNWTNLNGNGLSLVSGSTAAASNQQRLLNIDLSGTNANSTQTTYAAYVRNIHSGTSSTNIAGRFIATGGTNNYALQLEDGSQGIGKVLKSDANGRANWADTTVISPFNDSTDKYQVPNYMQYSGTGNAYFYGNSIVAGLSTTSRFTDIFCNLTGLTQFNYGVSGRTLEKQSPFNPLGGGALTDNLSDIPTKGSNDKLIVISIGDNDIGANYTNYNSTNFKAAYDTVIGNALGKGWKPREIFIMSPSWITQTGYNTYGSNLGITPPTFARQMAFTQAAKDVSKKYNCLFLDMYYSMKNNGDSTMLNADGVHPLAYGDTIMANAMYNYLNGSIYAKATSSVAGSFINNSTSQQSSANFNVSGTGVIGTNAAIGTSIEAGTPLKIYENTVDGQGLHVVNANATYTFAPQSQFTQYGSNAYGVVDWPNAGVVLGGASGGLVLSTYENSIRFQVGLFVTRGAWTTTGLGIGNTSPSEKLDVTGNIKLSGYFETIPDYQTPTTGATITTIKTSTIIDPAGTLATLTINLPSSPPDGMIVAYSFSQVITALTFANGTLANPITASAAGGTVKFIYSTTGAKWYKWQ